MNILKQIQHWYALHCDGDWEHTYGIHIETLDNPGWHITIDLDETLLEDVEFSNFSYGDSEKLDHSWLNCQKEGAKFKGFCSSEKLEELLSIFLKWADENTDTTSWDEAVDVLFSAISSARTLEKLRLVYFDIDDIPNEHPMKKQLHNAFEKKWDEIIN